MPVWSLCQKFRVAMLATCSGLAACGGGPIATPAPAPVVAEPVAAPAAPRVRVVTLPMTLTGSTWRVTSRLTIDLTDSSATSARAATPGRQQVESQGLVTWAGTRTANGALQLTGSVDSFTVRSSFDQKLAPAPAIPAMILTEGLMDSTRSRVVPRPVLENECDRPEMAAASLAAEMLVRVPEGLREGAVWRDSTVTVVCRSALPMTVVSISQSTLEHLGDVLRIRRTVSQSVSGTGGSPFRAFDVRGVGTTTQRIEIDGVTGVIRTLDGSSDLTLTTMERVPQLPPRVMVARQRGELRAEIVRAR